LRAALVASCLRGAFPPVDLRAVCLVRAIVRRAVTECFRRGRRRGIVERGGVHPFHEQFRSGIGVFQGLTNQDFLQLRRPAHSSRASL
jgi:hypothetical protein